MFGYKLTEIRKFLVGVAGFVVTVLTVILSVNETLIPESLLPWVVVVIGVAASYGIFQTPNDNVPRHRA